jgi:hypothetical protein
MRTTLNLDNRVLHAARAKAACEGVSLGRAVSDLALETIDRPLPARGDLAVLPAVPGHVITDHLVYDHLDEEW